MVPFGYRRDEQRRLVPDPEQQRVVQRIRQLAADGLSPRKIKGDLAARGTKLSHVTIGKLIQAGEARSGNGAAR